MQEPVLTASRLSCRRGDRLLFGQLDISLRPGGAVRLIGPNGIGKTSLLRMLAGLLPPLPGGRIAWTGRIGLLDGSTALDPDRPLGKALGFWSALDRGPMPLARLGLGDLRDVPVCYLSTGQTRRAALARLIGQNADHWLLDEPLNGLDDQGARLVEALIAERRAAGGTVAVVSHQPIDLPDAMILDLRDFPA